MCNTLATCSLFYHYSRKRMFLYPIPPFLQRHNNKQAPSNIHLSDKKKVILNQAILCNLGLMSTCLWFSFGSSRFPIYMYKSKKKKAPSPKVRCEAGGFQDCYLDSKRALSPWDEKTKALSPSSPTCKVTAFDAT